MIRRWLNILSFVGLLLSVVFWIRSHLVMDWLRIPLNSQTSYFGLSSALGVISIGTHVDSDLAMVSGLQVSSHDAERYRQVQRDANWFFEDAARKTGRPKPPEFQPIKSFRWHNSTIVVRGRTLGSTSVSFPHWLLALAFTVPFWKPGWLILKKHRRARLGLCVSCGYNLRGLTESRCPECSTPFEHSV